MNNKRKELNNKNNPTKGRAGDCAERNGLMQTEGGRDDQKTVEKRRRSERIREMAGKPGGRLGLLECFLNCG